MEYRNWKLAPSLLRFYLALYRIVMQIYTCISYSTLNLTRYLDHRDYQFHENLNWSPYVR